MAAERESEYGRHSSSDFSEYEEMFERPSNGAARSSRNTGGEPLSRREASAQSAPRRAAPQHAGQRQAAGRHSAQPQQPARRQQPAKRRRSARERRRRRQMRLLCLLVLAIGAVIIISNLTVGRVKGFEVSSSTANQQVLSWKKTGGADSYNIYDGSGTFLAEVDADNLYYAVNDLRGGTQYSYSIVAVKNFFGKHLGKAASCSAYTLPEAVSSLSATSSGTGVFLSWDSGGAGGYEIQYADPSGVEKTIDAAASDAGGLAISDLLEGAQYTFQIRSFVQNGDSRVYSDWISTEPITVVHTVDMAGVDVNKPMVALTFDDGPDYEDVTERILDTLKEYGGHASFFQLGNRAIDLPELMTRIATEGHEVACHTYDHEHYGDNVTADDIVKGDDAIEQACGKRPTAFRSPGGSTTDRIREICGYEGMPIYYWSLDTEDWNSRDADAVYDAVTKNVSDGDIILMHNIYSSTADAVERIVPYLVEKGYQLVTVSQLVQAKTGNPPVPGTQYVTAISTN